MDAVESLKEKMVMVCKVLQKLGLVDGYGHVTARLADGRILSTPHMPPGKVALRDLIIIDANGKKLEGFGEPNGETAMHTSIYKARPDVQCILHYHADEVVAISVATEGIKVIANCGVHFHDADLRLAAAHPQCSIGRQSRRHPGRQKRRAPARPWCHGGTVVAHDLDTLMRLGIDLVRSARIQIMTASLGPVKTHSQAECEEMAKGHDRPNANRRYIDYYISEVVD